MGRKKKLTNEKNHIRGTFWTDAAVSENLIFFFFFGLSGHFHNRTEVKTILIFKIKIIPTSEQANLLKVFLLSRDPYNQHIQRQFF